MLALHRGVVAHHDIAAMEPVASAPTNRRQRRVGFEVNCLDIGVVCFLSGVRFGERMPQS